MNATAPDWGTIIRQLMDAGLTSGDIAREMGLSMVTDRMIRQYASGVQPLYHRGDRIIRFWMVVLKRTEADIPMVPLVRGHRVARRPASMGPALVNLPQWPTAPAATVQPIKRKVGRPPKVREAA